MVNSLLTAGCSAAQISFFVETGGEIQWMAASRVLGGSGGLGLLLSGLPSLIVGFTILYGMSWIIASRFYDAVEYLLNTIGRAFCRSYHLTKKAPKVTEAEELLIPLEDQPQSPSTHEQQTARHNSALDTPKAIAVSFTTLTFIIVTLFLYFVRPGTPPYAHMSGSLPITLIEAALFQPINSEFCLAHPVDRVLFPWDRFTDYFVVTLQTAVPHGHREKVLAALGGMVHRCLTVVIDLRRHFGIILCTMDSLHLRLHLMQGMDSKSHLIRLRNFDTGSVLADDIKARKLVIKNVLLLTLESTRKDMYPLKRGSHAYETMLSSYASANASAELDAKLRNLTKVASFLSGESNGFGADNDTSDERSWRHAFRDGMGGINVQGAITQAAYTLKSLLSSHCGVEPLPVDFTEETKGEIYQSCLPQVLRNMNIQARAKHAETPRSGDYRTWVWKSALVQSVTDQFDSQDILDEQMGFRNVISERVLSDPTSEHYPPKEPWVNYFGYPETETLGYLRDMFVNARLQQKRLFVSHLTSSPHHPFATPKDWTGHVDYLAKQRWRPDDPLDDYLNTIKYQDDWVADIFQMLHEVGALNETLIIVTGDHGLAFKSLDKSQSAVNNGHISNFAIPLLFIHPDLPRLQLKASTTPLSIIPTVLDLLLQTDSLEESAADAAKIQLPRYQGNSLIRNLNYSVLTGDGGVGKAFFQPFHFSAINPGGSLLAISDASSTYRLVFPLCSSIPLRFTDIAMDSTESDPVIAWTMDELVAIIKVKHGVKATEWAKLAQDLGRWWFWDQHGKWGYWGNARATGRGGAETAGAGRVKKKHWWETKR
ncbi:hypothetical protein N0V91_003775 [Didymella pomorum]|uniref:Sulfatase N-terminal domain-containing protein n=1 Tax=Didymella pomorum TaxID=749634 RepID=A0A9W9D9S3_9PLEO|nr:hypothetical protein N0V91_003775 [Didymella pomorum]